jgi:hypothetical protein
MKKYPRFLYVVVALIAIFVSACGGAVPTSNTSAGSDKPRASLVEFTGVIEAMDGNQWTINGQTITVDPTVLRDGPFVIGDTVKVEAEVQVDGSVVVTRVEPPVASVDNSNDNTNDDNSNSSLGNVNDNLNGNDNTNSSSVGIGSNSNDDNSNDSSLSNSNTNDDNSNDSNSNDDDHGSNSGHDGDDDDDNSNSGGSDD